MNLEYGELKAKIVAALRAGNSVWSVFFLFLVESRLIEHPKGMNPRPTDEQVAGWLRSVPGFPASKIDYRIGRVKTHASQGPDDSSAMDHIAGDFAGYLDDAARAK